MNLEDRKKIAAGTPVVLREDNGELTFTRTRSEPWQLGGNNAATGAWVVLVEGKSGGYSLERITPNAPLIEALNELSAKSKALHNLLMLRHTDWRSAEFDEAVRVAEELDK